MRAGAPRLAASAVALSSTLLLASQATTLTQAEIDKALKDGASGKKIQATCSARGTFPQSVTNSFSENASTLDKPVTRANFGAEDDEVLAVVVQGPVGRVMQAGHDAHNSAPAVTPSMVASTVVVSAQARHTEIEMLENVRLASKNGKTAPLMPLSVLADGLSPDDHGGSHVAATFDLAGFKALAGDIQISVISQAGPRTCTISAKSAALIR